MAAPPAQAEAFRWAVDCAGRARLEIGLDPYLLHLRSSFGTSHSSTTWRQNALLSLRLVREDGEVFEGLGEVGLPPKKRGCYEADYGDIRRFTEDFARSVAAVSERELRDEYDPVARVPPAYFGAVREAQRPRFALEGLVRHLFRRLDEHAERCAGRPDTAAALCGLELALWDLWGALSGLHMLDLLGARRSPRGPPRSFYTAALHEEVDEMVRAARFGRPYTPLLKIKVDADLAKVVRILDAMEREFKQDDGGLWSVDANAAWTPDIALEFLRVAHRHLPRIYMVEQPFPLLRAAADGQLVRYVADRTEPVDPSDVAQWQRVRQAYSEAGVRIFADESVCRPQDVLALRSLVHGCNVKMEKAGGYRGCLQTMDAADQAGLLVWIGIMVSSSLNSTAAAFLLPLASSGYGDVDGPLLLTAESQLFTGGFRFGPGGVVQVEPDDLLVEPHVHTKHPGAMRMYRKGKEHDRRTV